MALWKVNCQENEYPGMWQRWFRQQSVGVGWPAEKGYHLEGPTKGGRHAWSKARAALKAISVGDDIVVALRGHRVGRFGRVTAKAIGDAEWEPFVPPSQDLPAGEKGRRISVRWDLTIGPDDRDKVVALPPDVRLNVGELRPTIARVHSRSTDDLKEAMKDESNWVDLFSGFVYEKHLAGYVASYPHRLEDGLLRHPNEHVRERVFRDKSRLDVLLTDEKGKGVIVECKQGGVRSAHLKQIRHYMELLHKETGIQPRGILVQGGARKLRPEVAAEARVHPQVEIVHYALDVKFTQCR